MYEKMQNLNAHTVDKTKIEHKSPSLNNTCTAWLALAVTAASSYGAAWLPIRGARLLRD